MGPNFLCSCTCTLVILSPASGFTFSGFLFLLKKSVGCFIFNLFLTPGWKAVLLVMSWVTVVEYTCETVNGSKNKISTGC